MGSIWLDGRTAGYRNVVTVLREAGVNVVEYEGWSTRSRGSGGFSALQGIVVHHTASDTTPANDLAYMVYGNPDAPVSNGLLDRTGTFTIIAGGASNHAGKGGPLTTSRGVIAANNANAVAFGIEAANSGVGQPWPEVQQDAYQRMVGALAREWGMRLDAGFRDAFAHYEWTTRKCDPAGPARWAPMPTGGCSERNWWDMPAFRADAWYGVPVPPEPPDEDDLAYPYRRVARRNSRRAA